MNFFQVGIGAQGLSCSVFDPVHPGDGVAGRVEVCPQIPRDFGIRRTAEALGNRIDLDFEKDPPPDVAVEVDVTRHSISKFGIYAGLGVPEVWIYDGKELKIHLLEQDEYLPAIESQALHSKRRFRSRLAARKRISARSRADARFQV